jgi:uncharacterized membrane protein YdjX (TVP38/TMEM64 family)
VRRGPWLWAAVIAAAAALVLALRLLPIGPWLERLLAFFQGQGLGGIALFVVAYATLAVLLVPGSVLTLGAGFVYGVAWGSVAVSIAATLGAAGGFLVARYLARERVARFVAANPRFAAIDAAVGREGWKIVLLTRLSPIFPYTYINYLYGLTRVALGPYLLASWVGMLPGTVLYVYLGFAGRAVAQAAAGGARRPAIEYAFWALGLLATAAVTVYVTRLARAALRTRSGV